MDSKGAWITTVGVIIAAVVSPVLTAWLAPDSKLAATARDILPTVIVQFLPKPTVSGDSTPGPSGPAPAPPGPVVNPSKTTPTRTLDGVAMRITPSDAPLEAIIAAPVTSGAQRLSVTFYITAKKEALPVFVPENGHLKDWSARVIETGAYCSAGRGELHGIKSFADNAWKEPDAMLDQLPLNFKTPVDQTLFCDKRVTAGETLVLVARIDVANGGERSAVRLSSPGLRITDRR